MPQPRKKVVISVRTDFANSTSLVYRQWRRPRRKIPLFLSSLPGYLLTQPIPVSVQLLHNGEFMAAFPQANLAMCGASTQEALELLADDIAETFSVYLKEQDTLGPEPRKQLGTLRQYIQG